MTSRRTLLAFLFFLIFQSTAMAHPAREIILSAGDGQVKVRVLHGVDDPQKHFINRVLLFVNGKQIVQKDFSGQATSEEQDVTFSVPELKAGDSVKVEATCVIFGNASATLVVK